MMLILLNTYDGLLLYTVLTLFAFTQYTISTSNSQDDNVFGWLKENENIISQHDLDYLSKVQHEEANSSHITTNKATNRLQTPLTTVERGKGGKIKVGTPKRHNAWRENLKEKDPKRYRKMRIKEYQVQKERVANFKKEDREQYRKRINDRMKTYRLNADNEEKKKVNELRVIKRRIQMKKALDDILAGNATEKQKNAYKRYSGKRKYEAALAQAATRKNG